MRVIQCAEKPSIIFDSRPKDKSSLCRAVYDPGAWCRPSSRQCPPPTRKPLHATPDSQSPATIVLDTNVLLDLLLFDDPRAHALRSALLVGRLQAVATAPMLDELADVLQRPFAAGWPTEAAEVLALARGLCRLVEPATDAAPRAPVCSDPDDQKFIDLAWGLPAAWLISRDRALLRLARPARQRGLRIGTPADWAREADALAANPA